MITMIAHHAVKDYEAWISGGKEAMKNTERNAQSGIVASKVYRTADGSGVIVMHTFNNLEAAQKYEKMMQSPEGHAMDCFHEARVAAPQSRRSRRRRSGN